MAGSLLVIGMILIIIGFFDLLDFGDLKNSRFRKKVYGIVFGFILISAGAIVRLLE